MTRPHVTSQDVARAAGVSQSAVSRAFNPGAVIAEATRARVRATADALGYRPNALARSLITRRSNMIALVMGGIDDPFHARNTGLISRRLQARGYHVLLFSVTGDDKVDAALAELLRYRVDGALLASAALSSDMAEACQALGVPVLLYNRYAHSASVSSVRIENHAGGRAVADHLLDAGHRNIAFIAGSAVDETSHDREMGFTGRLIERGGAPPPREAGDFSFESGHAAMLALWAAGARPDAVFATSDMMALGALDAARLTLGLKVPADLAIVGFDDLPMAAWPSYALTTVRQPVEAMADAAVDLLLGKIEAADGEAVPRTLLLPGTLVVRESSRPAP